MRISRAGFEWAPAHACLSHYDRAWHPSAEAWHARLSAAPVPWSARGGQALRTS
jgi:hypothetical protein